MDVDGLWGFPCGEAVLRATGPGKGKAEEDKVRERVKTWVCEKSRGMERVERESFKNLDARRDVGEEARDDVKGGKLNSDNVKKARREEVEYMEKRGMWCAVKREVCWAKTGKAPISVKWVIRIKGMG